MNACQQQVVALLIEGGGFLKLEDQTLSRYLQQAVLQLYTWGMMVPDNEEGDSWEALSFRITSPMHMAVMAQQLYRDTQDIQDIKLLVRTAIQRMDPNVLRLSVGRTASSGRPLEGVYHHELYRVICSLLPRDGQGVKAVFEFLCWTGNSLF